MPDWVALGKAICKVLGLDPNRVTSIHIDLRPAEPIQITTYMWVPGSLDLQSEKVEATVTDDLDGLGIENYITSATTFIDVDRSNIKPKESEG